MNVFLMQNSIVRPLGRDMQNVLIGFVGEHEARTFFVRTRDDLTGYTISLVIGDVDCGAMTKAPMPDGSTMLSLTLTSDMLGKGGDKVCQLLMTKDAIVRKSSQFRAYVGESNDINGTAPDSATIIIISEKITELVHEAALDAIEEVQEVIDSIPADYSTLSAQVDTNTEDIDGLKADLDDVNEYNAYDILRKIGTFSNGSSYGVSYAWNADKTECTITGTATGSSFKNIYSGVLPSELKAGEKYPVLFESSVENILSLELIAYLNGDTSGGASTYIRYSQDYEIPQNCTRIVARLRVKSGSIVNAIVKVAIINTQTNKQLSDDITELKNAVDTIPSIDATLTTSGSAADAKIVGDKFKQVFGYNGNLGVNDNLNTLTKPGFYTILNNNYPANYPFTNSGGRLLVIKSTNENTGTMQWQLIVAENLMKYRYSVTGTAWTDWKTTANIDDIPSADSIVKYIPFYTHNINSTVPTLDEEKISGGYSDYVSTIYGFWDVLMSQYPQFITKEELTLPDDIVQSLPNPSEYDNGATVMIPDGDGYVQYRLVNGAWVSLHTWRNGAEYNIVKMSKKIYAYTISPYKNRTNRDKILWISGLHGHEKMTHIATCYMFKELLDRYSIDGELSHFLVKNDIVVIPIADVSGTEGTYGTHGMTENYVNPNRDYPTDWEESQNEYDKTGNYPAYDPYTRMLMNYISSFNNVSYLVNKHDSSDLTSAKYIGYFVDNLYPFPYKYEVRVFDQLDAWLRFRYGWIYTDFIGSTWNPDSVRLLRNLRTTSTKGTLNQWTNSLGIAGGLFEISGNSGTDFDTDHTNDFPKIHAELSLNFLSGIIKYLESSI